MRVPGFLSVSVCSSNLDFRPFPFPRGPLALYRLTSYVKRLGFGNVRLNFDTATMKAIRDAEKFGQISPKPETKFWRHCAGMQADNLWQLLPPSWKSQGKLAISFCSLTPCVAGVWQGLQHHDQRVLQREVEGPATPGQQGLQQGGTSPRGSFVCFLSDVWSCFDVAMFPRAVLCSVAIIVCLRPLLQRAHKGPIPYKFLRKRLATYFLRIFTHSIFCQISSS